MLVARCSRIDDEVNAPGNWFYLTNNAIPIPNRFHDLVFGHELGQGTFSSVKYARQITKGKTRSEWPEFAVKIISTSKIEVRQK